MYKLRINPNPVFTKKKRGMVLSTSEARQNFADIVQDTFGDKTVFAFGRYGKALAALVPVEALLLLAGEYNDVDPDVERRIRHSVSLILAELAGGIDPTQRECVDEITDPEEETVSLEAIVRRHPPER